MKYKNSIYRIGLPLLFAVVLVIGVLIGRTLYVPAKLSTTEKKLFIYPQTDKIQAILNLIDAEYVDTVDLNAIQEEIIPEVLKKLDPHSVYISKEELKEANEELEGNFGGIGVQFSMQNDTVLVISVISGGPSEKVGIQPGDRIVTVNDSIVAGVNLNSNNIVKMLRGDLGTRVNVGIKRNSRPDLIPFEIIRGNIPVYSVDVSYMITDTIGYVKVSRFAKNTYQEFLTAIAKLKSQNCKKMIIDFRGNSGGFLDVAINMSNEFLKKQDLIVYTKGKSSARQNVFANGSGTCQDMDVAILIDEFSASASEIVAGAIQDNDRGVVIGRRSFGKGLVQQQIPLQDGSALRLTIARYYTPSGRSIQKPYSNGVEDYYHDLLTRFEHGEFFEKDSIKLNQELKFSTKAGRTVYGGGGIMPDIFVPRDTTVLTDYYYRLRDKGVIYQFALEYSDINRLKLKRFEDVNALIEHLMSIDFMPLVTKFATKKGVTYNHKQYQISKEIIEVETMAYIARNILNDEAFYPLFHKIDEIVKSAVSELKKEYPERLFDLVESETKEE